MATEVISSRHLGSCIAVEPEDVSTGSSSDVEMLEEDSSSGVPNEAEMSDSDSDSAVAVVPDASAPNHQMEHQSAESVSSSGAVMTPVDGSLIMDTSDKSGGISPNVHLHHHYHYFHHHHFYHLKQQQEERERLQRLNSGTASQADLVPSTPPIRAITGGMLADRLMITAGPQASSAGDQSPVISEPTSPITPEPESPTAKSSSSSSLSSHNTSALVRTISNGSTFGPINPANWPLFPSGLASSKSEPSSSQSKFKKQKLSQSTATTTEPLNLSNNSSRNNTSSSEIILNSGPVLKPSSTKAISATTSTTAKSHLQLRLQSPSQSQSSEPSNTVPSVKDVSTVSSSSVTVASASDNNAMINNPTNNSNSSSTSFHNLPSSGLGSSVPSTPTGTTTTILATTIPAQPSFPNALNLPLKFGEKYILVSQIEASNLYRCLDTETMTEYCCKVVLSRNYHDFVAGHIRMDGHGGINQVQHIVVGRQHTFILFEPSYGDLHSYVRTKRRLREPEAAELFKQILRIVADCHHNGIILRDLKLRKFIFSNKERTQLKLETLEGASLVEDDGEDDTLSDKHGCPAYVSPEILYSSSYSGMTADCWSLGVILYTMLVGRYPFHDTNPSVVFCKIRRGTYSIPDSLSKQAKCLIRSLIRIDPDTRLTAEDALVHQWFKPEKTSLSASLFMKRSHHHGRGHHLGQFESLSAAAAAAISHHHFHHHVHHSSSSNNSSNNSVHNSNASAFESFNDQHRDSMPYPMATPASASSSSSSHQHRSSSNHSRLPSSHPMRALISSITSQLMASSSSPTSGSSSASASSGTSGTSGLSRSSGSGNSSASSSSSSRAAAALRSGQAFTAADVAASFCQQLTSLCDQIVPDLNPANYAVDNDLETLMANS